MLETQVKRAMIDSARQVIMLIDSSKFGLRSLMRVIEFHEIDLLVTDDAAPEAAIAGLRARGVEVAVAP
jgi:DeoR/GlpR family transcriptional regulator of sugar metabolism